MLINLCDNVTCQNGAVCQPLLNDYRCNCLSSSYSGRHCEDVATETIIHKYAARTVGVFAGLSIGFAFVFVCILDVMKHIFNIHLTAEEYQELRRERRTKTLRIIKS